MKILIGQSYFRILDPKELERNMPYPPLGALYAATILKQKGHEILFFDAMLGEDTNEFFTLMKNNMPDLVLIYDDEFNYLTKMCLSNMRNASVQFIRKAKQIGLPVIVYSSDATDYSSYYLNAGCDAIIVGEGEITLRQVVGSFAADNFNSERENINGLKFLRNEEIVSTPKQQLITNLDEIPDPDYSFVDINRYKKIWYEHHGYYSLNISTTRGCPYRCNWCAKPLYGQVYHSRTPRKVAEQIKQLKDDYQINHIWITDDIFGLKPEWIKEFAVELKKLNTIVPYKCLSRPDLLLRGSTINDLKESGCEIIWVGAESGSQKILDAMDKGTTVEQIYESASKVHQAGMEIAFFIQFGYTGENRIDILLTRKMITDCLPEDIGISVSYPLPGTKFYQRVKSELKDKTNWTDSDDLDLMFTGTYERSFYKHLHRMVHAEYRFFRIIKNFEWRKFHKLPFYLLKFIIFRIKVIPFLKEEQLSPSVDIK